MPPTLLFDRSDRTQLYFTGPQASATLNGLVTNDVAVLTPGTGQYAVVLSVKSKIIADVRIFMRSDGLLLDTSAVSAPGLFDFFRKYVNPKFTKFADWTETMGDIGVFGPKARDIVAAVANVAPDALEALASYAHIEGAFNGTSVIVARVPDLGVDGYECFVPRTEVESVSHALTTNGATAGTAATWQAVRVAVGRPEWGIDMDDSTLPQEANLDELHGLSYTKGCYIGQETVARIHFRGHVNKTLRRLFVALAENGIPPRGALLIDESGHEVGDLRSLAQPTLESARLLQTIPMPDSTLDGPFGNAFGNAIPIPNTPGNAIGMVRREIEDGTILSVRWDENGETVTNTVRVLGKAKGAID